MQWYVRDKLVLPSSYVLLDLLRWTLATSSFLYDPKSPLASVFWNVAHCIQLSPYILLIAITSDLLLLKAGQRLLRIAGCRALVPRPRYPVNCRRGPQYVCHVISSKIILHQTHASSSCSLCKQQCSGYSLDDMCVHNISSKFSTNVHSSCCLPRLWADNPGFI